MWEGDNDSCEGEGAVFPILLDYFSCVNAPSAFKSASNTGNIGATYGSYKIVVGEALGDCEDEV